MSKRDQKAITSRITAEFEKRDIDAALLTSGDAVFYATGFADSGLYTSGNLGATVAVVTKEGRTGLVVVEFALNSAKLSAAEDVEIISYPTWIYIKDYAVPGEKKEVQPDLYMTYRQALEFLPESKKSIRLGVQFSSLPYKAGEFLAEQFGRDNLICLKDALIEARAVKTPYEIDLLRRAAHYSELTMNKVARQITPGWTEADVVSAFNRVGFSWSEDIISVSNAHTIAANFTPSYIPQKTRIEYGDVIRLDGGPNVLGYNSDLARTFVVGRSTDPEREKLYEQLWAGYDFASRNIGPGVKLKDIFNGIHEVLEKKG